MDGQLILLLDNDEFVSELLTKEEPEDVQKLFSDNGVALTLDEVKVIGRELGKADEGSSELSEADLEGIAGGSSFTTFAMELLFEIDKRIVTECRRVNSEYYRRW